MFLSVISRLLTKLLMAFICVEVAFVLVINYLEGYSLGKNIGGGEDHGSR